MSKIKSTKLDLHLGGRPRVWRWDYNAIAEFTEVRTATGRPLESDTAQLRAMVWAGLLYAEPTLTLQTVGMWLNDVDVQELSGKLMETLKSALPDEPENPIQQTPPIAA